MIAFNLFWRPVYRYGIFYWITFLFGYFFLSFVGKWRLLNNFPSLKKMLTDDLDTFVLLIIWAIMLWWRLWHVFLYDWIYYSANFGEIMNFRDGWMSFIWWVIGVILMLLYVWRRWKVTWREFLLLWDLILIIVPLGILLWRYGNMLNKELYGKVMTESDQRFTFFKQRWLLYDYGVDATPTLRINTNILQSLGEWLLTFIIWQSVFWFYYIKKSVRPGMISWLFFIVYALVRFFAEWAKELPLIELYWILSISQRLMILFFCGGIGLLWSAKKNK
jgi:phosphatidylglycerol---prolipoprotein diacylglyceryl transferase